LPPALHGISIPPQGLELVLKTHAQPRLPRDLGRVQQCEAVTVGGESGAKGLGPRQKHGAGLYGRLAAAAPEATATLQPSDPGPNLGH